MSLDSPPNPSVEADSQATPPAAAQSAEQVNGAQPPVEQAEAQGVPTVQLPAADVQAPDDSAGPRTIPLPELTATPPTPLPDGTIVCERYQVVMLVGTMGVANIYRVVDLQGYRRCWACGSESSLQGDIYCVECGAQLTGHQYRLEEFAFVEGQPNVAAMPLAPALLDNAVPGVAHVYDTLQDDAAGRSYVVWEEAYGRTMSSWLPGADPATTVIQAGFSGYLAMSEAPTEEQALFYMAQAAQILRYLHANGIVGCPMTLDNLLVQPGDRLLLLNPSGCRTINKEAPTEQDLAAQKSDVQSLAAELEQWFLAVRSTGSAGADTGEPSPAGTPAAQESSPDGQALISSADETTGPLGNALSPSVVLARAREGIYPTAEGFASMLQELYEASKPLTNLRVWSGRASDVGRVRQINEDSLMVIEATVLEQEESMPVGLYVIADGMGGHQSGEVASSIAARTIGAIVNSSLIGPMVAGDPVASDAETCAGLLRQAVMEANRRIAGLARERHSDLGTTVTAALIVGNQACVANVGDSRTYLWHNGQLAVMTRDHSLVAQLVASGQIAPEEIYTHPRRNEIYRALGDPRLTEPDVDLFSHRLQPGDGLLLCSDGLWDFVRDPLIANLVAGQEPCDPQIICQALVDRANTEGGEDNISVIFARVETRDTEA